MVYGDGSQTRDYIYVDDVVNAMAAAATAEGINRQVINVGTGIGTNANELIEIIEQVAGKKAQSIVTPSVSAGVSTLVANTQKARNLLGFKAKTDLLKGLALLKENDPQFS